MGCRKWIIAAFAFAAFAGWACDTGTVRDAGFHSARDMFRLNVIAPRGDAQGDALYAMVEDRLRGCNGTLNIAPTRIEPGAATRWDDYGLDGPPAHFPAATLTGEVRGLRQLLFAGQWNAGLSAEDVAALLDSPLRTRLAEAVLHAWAVLLYSPGPNSPPERAAIFDRVAKRWAIEQSPGVTLVTFDRNDPRERTLRAFAGLDNDMPDWLGIVFGKGKLLLPPLLGDKLTENGINEQLKRLAVQCTCIEETTVRSVSVPMRWDAALDKQIPAFTPRLNYAASALTEPASYGFPAAYVLAPILAFAAVALAVTGLIIRRARRQ